VSYSISGISTVFKGGRDTKSKPVLCPRNTYGYLTNNLNQADRGNC